MTVGAYAAILFFGSYYIGSGFHIPIICKAYTDQREVALTFDDGPVEKNTSIILDILKKNNIQAAFFCIGKRMNINNSLVHRINEEGHIIGNHSYSHHFFFDLFSKNKMLGELRETNKIAQAIIHKNLALFRPPYGVTTPVLAKAIKQGGLTPIGWSLRSMDTTIKDKNRLVNKINNNIKPGDVLLMHDSADVTAECLQEIIDSVSRKGFKFVRLDRLLKIQAYV
ncbi:MAG: polysaccharide deacetylase family protein [Bacteroidetes bacterium]|nr:polysaccharide deacetylase family protein [Bacteroidota bacterium]HET6244626.1 polysaccharide deacetylase family protein [Bacteroidia bacterium]